MCTKLLSSYLILNLTDNVGFAKCLKPQAISDDCFWLFCEYHLVIYSQEFLSRTLDKP